MFKNNIQRRKNDISFILYIIHWTYFSTNSDNVISEKFLCKCLSITCVLGLKVDFTYDMMCSVSQPVNLQPTLLTWRTLYRRARELGHQVWNETKKPSRLRDLFPSHLISSYSFGVNLPPVFFPDYPRRICRWSLTRSSISSPFFFSFFSRTSMAARKKSTRR